MNIGRRWSWLVALALAGACARVPHPPHDSALPYASDSIEILREVNQRGAKAVLWELYDQRSDWDRVLHRIERGAPADLEVARVLRSVSDAGASEELTIAVTLALLVAPDRVLALMIPSYPLALVCTSPDTEDDSLAVALERLEQLRASVAAVADAALVERRDACLHSLDDARAAVRRHYGIE